MVLAPFMLEDYLIYIQSNCSTSGCLQIHLQNYTNPTDRSLKTVNQALKISKPKYSEYAHV